ncbi:hypothetical protein [Xanthomonas translucens]|uniref:hypothetical protein n=1 Tax=Xanthomonas campestris pv. translucens TaxID=343 RepID=UPI0012D884CC|nr:hypothetical protein [Xanthomonas translucens]QSQ58086.1 hypothetical protein ISN37_09205 [Xanthomonas translucens pv. undulosa]WLA02757.1 hypothetical protein MO330_09730 [Xanthomonas translucens]
MNIHANDKLAALQWAVEQARAEAHFDDLVRLNVLPALQQLRDDAQREARGG